MYRPSYSRASIGGVKRIKRDSYSNATTDWWTIRKEVYERDGKKCQVLVGGRKCGSPGEDVHHIIPLSRGGMTVKSNLITICKPCHDARHRGRLTKGNK